VENRYKINFDLKNNTATDIKFKQGDNNSAVLEVAIFDGGATVDITDEVIEFRFKKADGNVVFQDMAHGVSIVGGAAQCILMGDVLSYPGIVICEIYRELGDAELIMPAFSFYVAGSIEGAILSGNYISAIEQIKTEYQAAMVADQNLEVVNARGTFETLGERIDGVATKTEVAAVASGSPKGTFADLAALMADTIANTADGKKNTYLVLGTGGTAEVDTLTVTAIPTLTGNLSITLNGVTKTVAVSTATDTTATLVATKIRAVTFTGWTNGGTGAAVTYTKTTAGTNTPVVFSAGTTGVTATFALTTPGVALSTSDWYFWNGTDWTDGGVYQGVSNAEITDARVDAFGATYSIAGDAIRGQATELNVSGGYKSTGSLAYSVTSNYKYTVGTGLVSDSGKRLVKCYPYGATRIHVYGYTFGSEAGLQPNIVFLDSNNAVIQALYYGTGYTIDKYYQVPANTSYIYLVSDTAHVAAVTFDGYLNYNNLHVEKNDIYPYIDAFNKMTKNLIDEITITAGYHINASTGSLETSGGTIGVTDFIPVKPSTIYNISRRYNLAAPVMDGTNISGLYYDSHKAKIGIITSYTGYAGSLVFQTPANCAYVRVTLLDIDLKYYQMEAGAQIGYYIPYGYEKDYHNILSAPFLNKKIAFIGDSITDTGYPQYACRQLGAICVQLGVGGTTVSDANPSNYMAGATRIATIPVDSDMVVILGGANDWSQAVPIGTLADCDFTNLSETGLTTYLGWYQLMLNRIRQRCTNPYIIVCDELYRYGELTAQPIIMEYYRKAVRDLAYFNGIPCLKVFENMGINAYNYMNFYADIVHPSESATYNGVERLGNVVASQIVQCITMRHVSAT